MIDPLGRLCYSQEGEDLVLFRALEGKKTGFYVDVGAHHPKRFSNTHFFYKLGWHGINIEPNPLAAGSFANMRRRDINLQLGVSSQRGELEYYHFDDPALNTFNKELAVEREALTPYKIVATQKIRVERLDAVLDAHLPSDVTIDFLTVDVEGLDLEVLKSNDWVKFRPHYIVVEALGTSLSIDSLTKDPLITYLQQQDFRLFAKTYNSLCFVDNRTQLAGLENA
jgi:FkbM family methyltransferase